MIDIVEILLHWSAGRTRSEIARSLGVDRGTVAKYTTGGANDRRWLCCCVRVGGVRVVGSRCGPS